MLINPITQSLHTNFRLQQNECKTKSFIASSSGHDTSESVEFRFVCMSSFCINIDCFNSGIII